MSTISRQPSHVSSYQRREAWKMDPQIQDIQPGGGIVIRLEQGWGRIRRWWLLTFRKSYVKRMESCRQGDYNPCPHPVIDPRDLKYYQNQGGYYWRPEDDPFQWRNHLPFARSGLAELFVMGGGWGLASLVLGLAAANASGMVAAILWIFSAATALFSGLIIWFFRNPTRVIPIDPNVVVSPADGKLVEIEELEFDEYIGGPALKIGIFLSIFNVHINRAPIACRVIGLKYRPGKYLNALRPESARENEQVAVMIEGLESHRPMIVRQITGAIARRIVCWIKPDDQLNAGEQFGMIKLGSRTELVVPKEAGLTLKSGIGDKLKAGSTILLSYDAPSTEADPIR